MGLTFETYYEKYDDALDYAKEMINAEKNSKDSVEYIIAYNLVNSEEDITDLLNKIEELQNQIEELKEENNSNHLAYGHI